MAFKKIAVSKKEEQFREDNAEDIAQRAEDISWHCTVCRATMEAKNIKVHPVLSVAICKDCFKFYTSGDFTVDENGDQNFCTWCGQGGRLFCCDCKEGAFCKTCIKRNVEKDLKNVIEDDNWACYLCNSKPIWKLRAYCAAGVQRLKRRQSPPPLNKEPTRESIAPNMQRLSQMKKALGSRRNSRAEDKSEDEADEFASPLKPRQSTFIARDDEDPRAEPSSDESSENEEHHWDWAREKKKKKKPPKRMYTSSLSESGTESEERKVPKLKIRLKNPEKKKKSKHRVDAAKSESEEEEERVPRKSKKAPKQRSESQSEEERVPKKIKKPSKQRATSVSEEERVPRKSKKVQKQRSESESEERAPKKSKKSLKQRSASESDVPSKKDSIKKKPSSSSTKKKHCVEEKVQNKSSCDESESEKSVTVVKKKIKGQQTPLRKYSSDDESTNNAVPKESPAKKKPSSTISKESSGKQQREEPKSLRKSLKEPKPSTSFALDESSGGEDFQSSSGEEEINLDWFTSSITDFETFLVKNQNFLEKIKEDAATLDNNSTMENVRDTSRKLYKHFSKCVKVLSEYKKNFSTEYLDWCTKYLKKNPNDDSKEGDEDKEEEENEEGEEKEAKKAKKGETKAKTSKSSTPNQTPAAAESENESPEADLPHEQPEEEQHSEVENEEEKQIEVSEHEEAIAQDESTNMEVAIDEIPEQNPKSSFDASDDYYEQVSDVPIDDYEDESNKSVPEKRKHGENLIVEESTDEEDLYFDTNTLHLDTEANKSLEVLKTVAEQVAEALSEKAGNSTRGPFSDNSEEEDAVVAPQKSVTKQSPSNSKPTENSDGGQKQSLSKKSAGKSPKTNVSGESTDTTSKKKFVGKKPGPASKTVKSATESQQKLSQKSQTPEAKVKKEKADSMGTLESQATYFSFDDKDNEISNEDRIQEELAKKALLEDSSDEDKEEPETPPVQRNKELKKICKRESSSPDVSNWDEFADDKKLNIRCVAMVEPISVDKVSSRRRKKPDSDAEIENLCDLDALENPSTSRKSTGRSKRSKSKKKSNSEGKSDQSGSSGASDNGGESSADSDVEQKSKKNSFKPLDEEEQAKQDLLLNSDSDEDINSAGSSSNAKKKTKTRTKKRKTISDSSEDEKSNWKKDKLLKSKLDVASDSDSTTKKKKKAVIDSDDSEDNKKSDDDDIIELDSSDDFQPTKKKATKRRRKSTSSEASIQSEDSESDDELFFKEVNKKKRKRIVLNNSSDSEAVSGKDEPKKKGSPMKGKTRKILRKSELEVATQDAAREEKERLQRYNEQQKIYNKIIEERGQDINVKELVLEFDPATKEPLVEVHKDIATKLKPHQLKGIKFMWTSVFESLERTNNTEGNGCILAHCMGLGKTLQIVSLVHTVLVHPKININTVLIVTPLTTIENWKNEFAMWTKSINDGNDIDVFDLSSLKKPEERRYQLKTWHDRGGVMIISYDLFRILGNPQGKGKLKAATKESFQKTLIDPGPDVIICDEGHVLKNEEKKLSLVMTQIRTRRRIILTGTPLQNNLLEYHCMVQFVKPNFLGNRKEFTNRFVNPIKAGQHIESTDFQVRIMKKRACVLHKMLEGSVQRYDYSVLKPHLQEKFEYVIKVRLSEVQIRLYTEYLGNCARRMMVNKGASLFSDYQNLLRVWNHPYCLLLRARQDEDKEDECSDGSLGSLKDFVVDDSGESGSESDSNASSDGDRGKRTTRQDVSNGKTLEETTGTGFINSWWRKTVTNEELDVLASGNKMILLFSLLKECSNIGDKLLVFSQSLYTLNLIEHFLEMVDEASDEEREKYFCGMSRGWQSGVNYFRIDGQTNVTSRAMWIKRFNSPTNMKAKLFLVSTRAGGLGVNMVGANRVVIFDASWNPSNDMQSIFRVYRFGQTKPCYIYRFLAAGTMEEKIYDRQVTKLALSGRVVDKHTIDRHYTQADLEELYSFEPNRETDKTMPFPKDRLLAELYQSHKEQMEEYFEHDSLLEDRPEENLTEEEQRAAWYEFEHEKEFQEEQRLANIAAAQQRALAEQQLMNMRVNAYAGQNDLNQELLRALMQNQQLGGMNQPYPTASASALLQQKAFQQVAQNSIQQAQMAARQQQTVQQAQQALQQVAQKSIQQAQQKAAQQEALRKQLYMMSQMQALQNAPPYQGQLEKAKQDHGILNQLTNTGSHLLSRLSNLVPGRSATVQSTDQDDDDDISIIPSTSKTVTTASTSADPLAITSGKPALKVRTDIYKK